MKKNGGKILGIMCAVLLSCFCCMLINPVTAHAAENERETVRVGFYPVANFQELHEDGTRSGFSYDYFIQIQKYTRWNYEFVDASYADCLKMLYAGEIDVMSGLTASPDKEEMVIFSSYSNFNTQNKLYAAEDNDDIFYESYDTFDGATVGSIEGLKTEELEQYCNEHDFTVNLVTYKSYEELETALSNKEIDMVYGASLSPTAKVKIVARFRKQPLYYAVTKSKPQIEKELDEALSKIIDNNPEFYTQMSEKYKINGANATATFTREEDAYIKSGQQIYLVVNDELAPISWYDERTGEYRGISIDVAREIEQISGLSIQPITAAELDALVVQDPSVQHNTLVMTADDNTWANSRNLMMTNHVVDSSVVLVTRTGKKLEVSQSDTVIAVPKNFYVEFITKDFLSDKTVVTYDTVQECLDAVNDKKADATVINSIVARYFLSMLKYTNLHLYAETGEVEDLSYGVYIDSDSPLLSILDKSLLCIGAARIDEIAIQYAHADEQFSLEAFYYSNPVLCLSMLFLLCLLIGLTIYFRLMALNAVRRAEQEKTLARFMGYVCAANEGVFEANLSNSTMLSYALNEQGEVTVEQSTYTKSLEEEIKGNVHPKDQEKIKTFLNVDTIRAMIDGAGGTKYTESRIKNSEGNYQWYAFTLQAIPKDKEYPCNFMLFMKNIDEAKRTELEGQLKLEEALEAAKEASDAKSGFLSRMSHELRTPINAIRGYNSLIQSSAESAQMDQKAILENVRESTLATDYLLALISDLLDIQAIEEDKITLVEEDIFADEYINNILNMIKQPLEEKHIHFTFERVTQISPYYKFDGVRFQQVLLNVLYNAIKFTPEDGAIHLSVRGVSHDAETTTMEFAVSDTGIGMSQEFIDQNLYQKFAQERLDLSTPYDGCGIGLAVSKLLLDKMGGTITCESKLGEGTTLRIQVTAKHIQKQTTKQSKWDATEYDLSGIRVLVCEDNKMNQNVEKMMLMKMNCEVVIAEDGQVGLEQLQNSTEGYFDIILMDIRMPNMDGLTAARAIRSLAREDVKNLPILAVSANAFEEDIQASLAAGMNEHLAKPVDMRILHEKIIKYCKVGEK